MNVSIFIPCFIDQIYPSVGMNMVKVLKDLGHTVHYPIDAICCGQPAYNAGFEEEAKKVCRKFLQVYEKETCIIIPSASCAGFIKNYYREMISDKEKIAALQTKIYEFTDFLLQYCDCENLSLPTPETVIYHSSCASLREYAYTTSRSPMDLLTKIKGLKVITLPNATTCCGFGGTFAIKFESVATSMAADKLTHIKETHTRKIISTDMSCLLHLGSYAQAQGYPLETLHIADIIARTQLTATI